jgi:hypothetical protein
MRFVADENLDRSVVHTFPRDRLSVIRQGHSLMSKLGFGFKNERHQNSRVILNDSRLDKKPRQEASTRSLDKKPRQEACPLEFIEKNSLPIPRISRIIETMKSEAQTAFTPIEPNRIPTEVKPGILYTTYHFPEQWGNLVTNSECDEDTMCPEYKAADVERVVARTAHYEEMAAVAEYL